MKSQGSFSWPFFSKQFVFSLWELVFFLFLPIYCVFQWAMKFFWLLQFWALQCLYLSANGWLLLPIGVQPCNHSHDWCSNLQFQYLSKSVYKQHLLFRHCVCQKEPKHYSLLLFSCRLCEEFVLTQAYPWYVSAVQHVAGFGNIWKSFLNTAVLGIVPVEGVWGSILLPDSCNYFY